MREGEREREREREREGVGRTEWMVGEEEMKGLVRLLILNYVMYAKQDHVLIPRPFLSSSF